MKTPEVWVMKTEEVSAGVYRIIATTTDGRRIEATGTDEERLHDEIMRSLATLDIQKIEGSLQ